MVGVAIDVRVDEGAKSEGRDEGEEDCDQDGHGCNGANCQLVLRVDRGAEETLPDMK